MNPVHPETENNANPLIELAHAKVLAALRGHGNDVSPLHALALRQLMEGMSNQGLGVAPGRFAYGLPPGTGKTQSVIAWIAAAWELRLGLSVAVSAAQIEALCAIKRDLLAAGIPGSDIGLRHSYGNLASEPDTGDEDRPIMLVSHTRIRGGRNAVLSSYHKGRVRDLLIWDETLMTANAESLSWQEVRSAAERLKGELRAESALALALQAAIESLGRELDAQAHAPPSPSILISASDLEAAQEQAKALGDWGEPMRRAAVKTVRALTRMIERPVSVARTGSGASGDGVIRYTIAVDPGLSNIVVLDASHPIRILAKNGGVVDRTTAEMRECKSYEKVFVCEISMPAGKTSLSNEVELNNVAARVADVIRQVTPSDHVLLVTFKGEGDRLPGRLKARLMNHEGIDTSAKVDGVPRLEILTWGQETSLNTLRHCEHVILIGVLRRNSLDLAASAAAAANDLSFRLTFDDRRELETSEMAHCVLQAMNRGSCRVMTEAGKADTMQLTIIGQVAGVKETLSDVLPGVQWIRPIPDHRPRAGSRTTEAAKAIQTLLRSVPVEQTALSIRKVKAAAGPSLGRDSWRVALSHGLLIAGLPIGDNPSRWEKDGQMLRRAA